MLIPSTLFLVLVYLTDKGRRSPLRAYCLVWIACMLPSLLGIMRYRFADRGNGVLMAFLLLGYNVAFVVGYWLGNTRRRTQRSVLDNVSLDEPRAAGRRILDFATLCALVGTLLSIIDYLFVRRIVLDDLNLVRELFVERETNWLERVTALLMWGALYTLPYTIIYLPVLSWRRRLLYIAPVVGLFLLGVLSAGRQAAFQILIVTLVALAFRKDIVRQRSKMRLPSFVAIALVAATMIVYMGFIARARQDSKDRVSKAEVLERLFNFDLDPTADAIIELAGPEVKDGIVEGLVYFNSPINMLPVFVSVDAPYYFGMITFPLIARRFEWLYGKSVLTAMAEHADRMTGAGVIGVGWFTGYSAFILDFGYVGCGIIMFIIGLFSRRAWSIYQRERSFLSFMLLVCTYVTVVYLPLFPAISDTNVLLLTIVSVLGWKHHRRRGPGIARFHAGEATRQLSQRGQVPVQ